MISMNFGLLIFGVQGAERFHIGQEEDKCFGSNWQAISVHLLLINYSSRASCLLPCCASRQMFLNPRKLKVVSCCSSLWYLSVFIAGVSLL